MPMNALLQRFGRTYPEGSVLFREGDLGDEMYIIHSGKVEISRELRGRRAVLAVLGPGDFFGEMAILNNRPRSATAICLERSQLLVIDRDTFLKLLRANADIAMSMIQKLAARLETANAQIEILLVRDANHRVAYTLRKLAERMGQPYGIGVLIPVSADELAERTGLEPHEVAEILARLEEAHLVESVPEGFVIPESDRLAEYLEFLDLRSRKVKS